MTEKEKRRVVNLWCDTLFGFYSLKPIHDKLRSLGVPVIVFAPRRYHAIVSGYLGVPADDLVSLESRHPLLSRVLARLETLFVRLFVPASFSPMYARLRKADSPYARSLSRLLPKPARPNAAYRKFFAPLVGRRLADGPVLAVTRVSAPYWISAATGPLHVIMESWDHPVNAPFLHGGDRVYTWNRDLGEDIESHQGLRARDLIFPLKFRYIAETVSRGEGVDEIIAGIANPEYRRHLEGLPARPFLTYVATTQSSNREGYEGEMHLIRQLCAWARRKGMALYVKPKPNGNAGEFDSLEGMGNVVIGIYGDSESRQMLDPDYHLYRYALLKRSRLIINVGTTFVLEAALAGVPAVQIRIGEGYPNAYFRSLCSNPHIEKYLNSREHYEYDGSEARLDAILTDALAAAGGGRADLFSRGLARWLTGGGGLEESVERLALALKEDVEAGMARPAGAR